MSLHENNTNRPIVIMVPLSYKYVDLAETMMRIYASSIMGDQHFLACYGMLPENQMDVISAGTFIKRTIQSLADNMPQVLLFFYNMQHPLDQLLLEAQTATNGIRHVLSIWWDRRQLEVFKAEPEADRGPTLRWVVRKALTDPAKGLPKDEVDRFVDLLYAEAATPKNPSPLPIHDPLYNALHDPRYSSMIENQKNVLAEAVESM